METRARRAVAATGPASQAVPSRKLGTSNARAKAKTEAGRSHKAMTRKAQVVTARAVPVSCSRIRVADSLGIATSAAKCATWQQIALKKKECKS